MDEREFQTLIKAGYTHVPVYRQLLADLDTPLSLYLKLADGPYSYLLESVEGGERWARYSIIGLPCRRVFKAHGHRWTEERWGSVVTDIEVFCLAPPCPVCEGSRTTWARPTYEAHRP